MKEPLVSVDMITYNHKPYIVRAIEGILQQKTNFPFELVIGEDCSTDGTREIVFEYQKKHPDIIRVITSEKNVGAKENAWRTVLACRAKYVADCEGDDYWHDMNKLQMQADYLESHPECGLVFTDFDKYYVEAKERVQDFFKSNKDTFPENPTVSYFIQQQGVYPVTCTVMVRNELIRKVIEANPLLYQSNKFMMIDTLMWVEISALAKVAYIGKSTATRNCLVDSASRSTDKRKQLRFNKSCCEMRMYLWDKHGLPRDRIRESFERQWCDYALRLAFHERDVELADVVRKKKAGFSFLEWLRYFGSRNAMLYCLIQSVVYCRDKCLFLKADDRL